jgi:hypothetical protein
MDAMVISDRQTASMDQSKRCNDCQHCVVVRGREEVVCLAYLTIRHPTRDAACAEFETKRIKPLAPATK